MTRDEAAFLAGYDPREFPPVAVAVDIAVLTIAQDELHVVLVHRDEPPYAGRWALPGGLVGEAEDADAAARRVLRRETGIRAPRAHLEQLRTFSAPDRDPRMRVVSLAYLSMLPHLALQRGAPASVRLWRLPDVGASGLRLAFDHEAILRAGLERAAAKLEYTTLATAFCPPEFTLGELRRVYETVWSEPLDPPNFRRKVLGTPGFVVRLGRQAGGAGTGRRASELFRAGPARVMSPPLLRPSVAGRG